MKVASVPKTITRSIGQHQSSDINDKYQTTGINDKYQWSDTSALRWTEITNPTDFIKIVPNGSGIKFRINDIHYINLSNKNILKISKITGKPYATFYLGRNIQSLFVYSAEEVKYKKVTEASTSFCFRSCDADDDFTFHGNHVKAIYSEHEGVIGYDDVEVNPADKKIADMYVYHINRQKLGQTLFKFTGSKEDTYKFLVEYNI